MRVLADLEEKWVAVILSPDEQEKFLTKKIRMQNIGQAYEYDDEVEYLCSYYITLYIKEDILELKVEQYGADTVLYPRLIVRFNDEKELETITEILNKYCMKGRVREWEKKVLVENVKMYHGACSVPIELNLYEIATRLLRIATALHLY